MQRLITGLLFAAVTTVTVFAGDTGLQRFAGTWKEDTSKTVNPVDPDSTLSYRQNPGGSLTETSISGTYKRERILRIDGKPHALETTIWVDGKLEAERTKPDPSRTRTWTQKGSFAWEERQFKNGKPLSTTLYEIAPDNRTMTETETDYSANGTSQQSVTVCQRTADGKGLLGTWKPVSTRDTTPDVYEIAFDSDGTLNWHEFALDYRYSAKFDGKDYPVTGPNVNPKLRESLIKIDDHTIEDISKDGERPFQVGISRLSSDANSIYITYIDLLSSTPLVRSFVYTRQAT